LKTDHWICQHNAEVEEAERVRKKAEDLKKVEKKKGSGSRGGGRSGSGVDRTRGRRNCDVMTHICPAKPFSMLSLLKINLPGKNQFNSNQMRVKLNSPKIFLACKTFKFNMRCINICMNTFHSNDSDRS